MPQFDLPGLAILLIAIGLFFFVIVRLMLALIPRLHPEIHTALHLGGEDLNPDHGDAVLIIEAGGRIKTINQRARQIFRLQDDEQPNLERLARKVRPSDSLVKLCAGEGQARFVLDGRLVEGSSYLCSVNNHTTAVVALRYPESAGSLAAGSDGMTSKSLQSFTNLTLSMASSLDLEKTIQAVFTNVEKIMPADFMEVTLWDAENDLFTPYRATGLPGMEHPLEQVGQRLAPDQGFSGILLRERRPLLIPDIQSRPDSITAFEQQSVPMRSYLGVPLLVGDEFIGMLQLGSLAPKTFREEDLALVQRLCGQASVAIRNALLFRAEQQRTAELSGLAQLSHGFGSVRDPDRVYARLIESIVPLVPVDVLGFLIYNEAQRVLEACNPFHGLPGQIVALYHAHIPPGSPAEQRLLDGDLLITENASEDEGWTQLGLDHIAQAASLRESVLAPLSTGGRMLGYLQASNHTGGSRPFSQAELHLLVIIANQTASIIENATLVQQSRLRVQRAEALRRISSLASSAASLEEILKYSIQELARLVRADVGAVFLLDQERTELRLHASSVFGTLPELPERLSRILVDDAQFHFTVASSQHILALASASQSEKPIIPFYQSMLEHWKVESVVAVPLVVRNEGIGELWLCSAAAGFFEQGDVQVSATAAAQLAGVVEQSSLRNQTDESLRRRVDQLMAITHISRELSTSLDLNYLLNLVYDEAVRITGADCGTILLFDLEERPRQYPAVRFFVGDMPDMELSPLERLVLEQDAPLNIPDFSHSAHNAPHLGIQSTLIVPISQQSRPAGLICLHGKSAGKFDETAIEITQSLAIQAAVALNNALAYEEQTRRGTLLKRELETLSRLIQVSRVLRPNQSLSQSLTAIAQAIQSATPFQVILISVYDQDIQALKRRVGIGVTPEMWEELQARIQPWRGVQQLLKPEYRVGDVYYIPESKTPAIPEDIHIVSVLPTIEARSDNAWRPRDLLLVPMYDTNQNPLGMISVDAPADNRQPDRPTFEALEVFAAQAGLIIDGHLRGAHLEYQLSELEQERARLEQAAKHAQRNLPVMLHKELEQSIALRSLNQRIARIRATFEIAALANQQPTEGEALHTLASQMITRFAMQVALIAEKTPAGLRLVEVVGSFPPGANPEALFGQRNPLRRLLQEKQNRDERGVLLIANLDSAPEWRNNTLLNALEAHSLIGMQLDIGEDRLAGVLVVGKRALPAFLDEDRRIFSQLAYQVSVGLQNLQLLNETVRRLYEVDLLLDFSRKLGSLQPREILKALIENVAQVLEQAQAGWVGIWEDKELAIIPQAAIGYVSRQDILDIRYSLGMKTGALQDSPVSLPLRAFRSGYSERISEVDFAAQYHLSPEDLRRYRQATNGRLPVSAMSIPLKIGETVLGVIFLESFDLQDAFSEEDEALASSFTRQAAMALENARLYQASERRAAQLQALTMVAGTITSSLQRDELISLLLDQLKLVLSYDTATLWLRAGDRLTVSAVTGFADNDSRLNLSAAVEDSALFKTMIETGEAISVGDLRNDQRFAMQINPEYLSWLGIPLVYKSEVIGLIALEKREADFYTADYIQAGTTFASQAAVSLENARLYEDSTARAAELDERSQRLALLNRLSTELAASLDMDHILNLTGSQLMGALNAAGVAVVMVDPREGHILQAEAPAPEAGLPLALPVSPIFDHLQETRGIFQTSDAASEAGLRPLWETFLCTRRARSLLVVPFVSGSVLQGWYLIYGVRDYRYTLPEIELARTICNQAAIAVQNARLFAETRRLTEDLERRVEERTRELRREHQNSQTLLHIITELSASLEMGLVLNRTLNVLNNSTGCEESLIVLSQSAARQYRAGMQLSQAPSDQEPGSSIEQQIAHWVIRMRRPILVDRVDEDSRWERPPGAAVGYQSVLAVPLVMGEEVLGTLLLFHRRDGFFMPEQIGLLEATARQIGIALNNAELFNLIRDQSEHLGGMLREQQIEASRSRAILEAVADGVLVTDSQNLVALFNVSAERILDLKSAQVLGKSLDHFSGMFSNAAAEWMYTIRNWSHDPAVSQNVGTYAEQLELDNGRIVAVHLAPVIWRQEFLGTVSIFRDITHEVQVDRLKSEFVANVSHELRTPMTSIKGYVEIMLMGAAGELNPQQDHFLRIVKSNTERLGVLVNDLLDISRIEAGRISLNLQPLDIHEIAKEVVADVRRRSQEENRSIRLALEAAPGLPFALGDLERVRQVLGSLVTNGYNYTPENGCVTVAIREISQEVQLDVRDNGVGIRPEAQHRIFERFYRGEDPLVLATAGTGLGLAIAKTLIEMHHGRIWFESSGVEGQGSTFSFTLPAYEAQD